jgi:hypothetical protein
MKDSSEKTNEISTFLYYNIFYPFHRRPFFRRFFDLIFGGLYRTPLFSTMKVFWGRRGMGHQLAGSINRQAASAARLSRRFVWPADDTPFG